MTALMLIVMALADGSALRDGVASLQRGDFTSAERLLRAEVGAHPDEAAALSLLGAALDNLKRPAEADVFHRRALAISRGADILNNFATHLMMTGDRAQAEKIYREEVAADPGQMNANLQLAQMALARGDAKEALDDLGRLPDAARQRAEVRVLMGIALTQGREFAKAEAVLEAALRENPANFTVLYNLGAAAVGAGHPERAAEVLEAARAMQPENVDALYALAAVEEGAGQWEQTLGLLARAARIDARRADIQKLTAIVATELGALADAAAAWDRYLALVPGDDAARRERWLLAALMGEFEAGARGIAEYVAKHPRDAVGHYELARAQKAVDTGKALECLNRALELDPDYEPALTMRGNILYQDNMPEAALKDLERAARLRPGDAVNLDRLGQTYQALDRTEDAVRVLREAARLAASDGKTQLHLARALADAGKEEESRAAMERFRALSAEQRAGVPAGLIEYLAQTPEERRAAYRERVEKALREHPEDAAAQLDAVKLAIDEGRLREAVETARGLRDAPARAEAGRALLEAREYAAAKELLAGLEPESSLAEFYLGGARPEDVGRVSGAFEKAIAATPGRRGLYLREAAFLSDSGAFSQAFEVMEKASQVLQEDRAILLLRAVLAERAGKPGIADAGLDEVVKRWPEWSEVWVARGMILYSRKDTEGSARAFSEARALGATVPAPETWKWLWDGRLFLDMH